MKERDLLAAKIDLLMKRLDDHATKKEATTSTVLAMDSHMMCEVYGNVGHSGNNCPKTHKASLYINNGFHQQQGNNNRWSNQPRPQGGNLNFNSIFNSNQLSLKDLVLG
jgi:hypothetical protein